MHRSAVTLMELLVTVTIIAVLISFLIPVIQMVRDSAQRVNCASRVRQAGAAYLAYSIQENGLIPSARLVNPAGGTWTWNNPNSSTMWYELIGPFLDQSANRSTSELVTANVLRCPTYQRDGNPWNWSGGGGSRDAQYDNKVFGYAVNTRLLRSRANDMGTGAALPENYLPWYTTNDHWSTEVPSDLRRDTRLARISAASTRALLADSNFVRMAVEPGAGLGWENPTTTAWHFNPVDPIDPEQVASNYVVAEAHFPTKRHRGRINLIYCDGHAGSLDTKRDALEYMRSVCYPELALGR